jgi:hypothetical protein
MSIATTPTPTTPRAEAEVPTKPPVSERKRLANARNARRSTGPRTDAGKNKSKYNNLRHGGRAGSLILPGEDPQELAERLDVWVGEHNPRTGAEYYELTNAVDASWRQDRLKRAEAARLTRRHHEIAEGFDDRQAGEVEGYIEMLESQPAAAVRGLRGGSAGIRWMLGQVELLQGQLAKYYGFDASQRRRLVSLLGKRPEHLFDDPELWPWARAYLAGFIDGRPMTAKLACELLGPDRPEAMDRGVFAHRVEAELGAVPTAREGQAWARARLREMHAELTERLELVGLREARDRAMALEEAWVDTGDEAARIVGYEQKYNRMRQGSMKELRALQAARRAAEAAGEGGQDPEPDAEPEPTEEVGAEAIARAEPAPEIEITTTDAGGVATEPDAGAGAADEADAVTTVGATIPGPPAIVLVRRESLDPAEPGTGGRRDGVASPGSGRPAVAATFPPAMAIGGADEPTAGATMESEIEAREGAPDEPAAGATIAGTPDTGDEPTDRRGARPAPRTTDEPTEDAGVPPRVRTTDEPTAAARTRAPSIPTDEPTDGLAPEIPPPRFPTLGTPCLHIRAAPDHGAPAG